MNINQEMKKPVENARREKLKQEKLLVYEKIMKYGEKEAQGECTAVIDFCFDYACNMNCAHCCNLSFTKKDRVLTLDDLRDIANQADELGLAQFNISGGEPLVFENLDDIVEAIQPDKFHISMNTNGLLLDVEKAKHLKAIGVDKVKVSIDSIDEEIYKQTRVKNEAYSKAINALFAARDADLQVVVNSIVSHQNAQLESTERMAKFCEENGFSYDIMTAKAIGRWEGKEEVLIDEDDANHIIELRNKYSMIHRDVFPTYGSKEGGCIAVKKLLHLTKYGDILPCPFIHISIGNIFEESLKDIIDRGLNIKYFKDRNPVCLSGEDRHFIRNYMSKFYGKPLPINYSEVFSAEDYCD